MQDSISVDENELWHEFGFVGPQLVHHAQQESGNVRLHHQRRTRVVRTVANERDAQAADQSQMRQWSSSYISRFCSSAHARSVGPHCSSDAGCHTLNDAEWRQQQVSESVSQHSRSCFFFEFLYQ
jgi:hypothetical protein